MSNFVYGFYFDLIFQNLFSGIYFIFSRNDQLWYDFHVCKIKYYSDQNQTN